MDGQELEDGSADVPDLRDSFRRIVFVYAIHMCTFLIHLRAVGLAQVHGFRGEAHTMEEIISRASLDIFYLEHGHSAWACK
jgi:hypothetical protein